MTPITIYSRRQILKIGAAATVSVVAGGVIAACGGGAASPAVLPSVGASAGTGPSAGAETTLQRIIREKAMTAGYYDGAPWCFTDSSGKLTGANVEVLRAVMEPIGVATINGVLGEFSTLFPGLVAGRFDAVPAGAYVLPTRCEVVAFGNPDYQQGVAFIVKKGNPKGLRSYHDVAQSSAIFGSSTGGAEAQFAQIAGIPEARIVGFPDAQTAAAALDTDRIDVMAFTPLELRNLIEQLNNPNIEFVELSEQPKGANGSTQPGFGATAFRKEDQDLIDAYNTGLADLFSSGKWLEIVTPFGLTASDMPDQSVKSVDLCKA